MHAGTLLTRWLSHSDVTCWGDRKARTSQNAGPLLVCAPEVCQLQMFWFDVLWTHGNTLSAAQRQERVFLRVYNGCHRMSRSASNEPSFLSPLSLLSMIHLSSCVSLNTPSCRSKLLLMAMHETVHAWTDAASLWRFFSLSPFVLIPLSVIRYSHDYIFEAVLTLKGGSPIYIRSNGSPFCFLDEPHLWRTDKLPTPPKELNIAKLVKMSLVVKDRVIFANFYCPQEKYINRQSPPTFLPSWSHTMFASLRTAAKQHPFSASVNSFTGAIGNTPLVRRPVYLPWLLIFDSITLCGLDLSENSVREDRL